MASRGSGDYLEWSHPALRALGLDADSAQVLGVGHAPKGSMRNRILFPLYRNGELVGYAGVDAEQITAVKLPSNLQTVETNIVKMEKKAT